MRRPERIVFLLVVAFTYLSFARPLDNPNEWSHLALTISLVERHTAAIDPFVTGRYTEDWSRSGDHYYSNKAPAAGYLAVPTYAVQRAIEGRSGADDSAPATETRAGWIAEAVTGILPTLVALALFLELLERRYGLAPAWALALAAIWAFGSLAFPYATVLFGHQGAGAFLAIGIALTLLPQPEGSARGWGSGGEAPGNGTRRSLFLAGLAMGVAVGYDYLASIGVLAWTVLIAWTHRREPRAIAAWIGGGAIPAALLAAYHTACFGAPWVSPYSHAVVNPAFLPEMGFGAPRADWIFQLTFGARRGLFYVTPVWALSLAGIGFAWRERRERPELLAAGAAFVAAILLMASWPSWYGGSCIGPRYLVAYLPLATLLLVPVARRLPLVTLALGAISALFMLAATLVDVLPDVRHPDPLFGWIVPVLVHDAPHPMENVFGALGLPLPICFVAYVALWSAAGWWIIRRWAGRASGSSSSPTTP